MDAHEYAPTTGVKAFREAVANLYNVQYRQGKESQYTYENVCIVPGGRAGLSRVAAVVGDVYVGYQVPEYTTYSEVCICADSFPDFPITDLRLLGSFCL